MKRYLAWATVLAIAGFGVLTFSNDAEACAFCTTIDYGDGTGDGWCNEGGSTRCQSVTIQIVGGGSGSSCGNFGSCSVGYQMLLDGSNASVALAATRIDEDRAMPGRVYTRGCWNRVVDRMYAPAALERAKSNTYLVAL